MSKTAKLILAVVIVALIAGGAMLLTNKDSSKDDTATQTPTPTPTESAPVTSDAQVAATVTYDGDKFSNSTDKIKAGQMVKVVNSSQKELEFDSDPHPVHTDNSELNVGPISPGESKTFTLSKKGMWGYHNHLDSSQRGEIAVE